MSAGGMFCGTTIHLFVNLELWDTLPPIYKSVIKAASAAINVDMQAQYDALNPAALRRLVGQGVQLRAFSPEILSACFDAAQQVCEDFSASNPDFKIMWESMKPFRNEENLWLQISDGTYDNFMFAQQRAGKL